MDEYILFTGADSASNRILIYLGFVAKCIDTRLSKKYILFRYRLMLLKKTPNLLESYLNCEKIGQTLITYLITNVTTLLLKNNVLIKVTVI